MTMIPLKTKKVLSKAKGNPELESQIFLAAKSVFTNIAKNAKAEFAKAKKQEAEPSKEQLLADAIEELVAQGVKRTNALRFVRESQPALFEQEEKQEEDEEMTDEEVVGKIAKAINARYGCGSHAAMLSARKAIAEGTVTKTLGPQGMAYLKSNQHTPALAAISKIAKDTGRPRTEVMRTIRKGIPLDSDGFDAAVQTNIAKGMSRTEAMRKARLENPEAFARKFR